MSVTVPTKRVGDVRDRICCGEFVKTLEDRNEDYIKLVMGI